LKKKYFLLNLKYKYSSYYTTDHYFLWNEIKRLEDFLWFIEDFKNRGKRTVTLDSVEKLINLSETKSFKSKYKIFQKFRLFVRNNYMEYFFKSMDEKFLNSLKKMQFNKGIQTNLPGLNAPSDSFKPLNVSTSFRITLISLTIATVISLSILRS
jgi:hypothetical protein